MLTRFESGEAVFTKRTFTCVKFVAALCALALAVSFVPVIAHADKSGGEIGAPIAPGGESSGIWPPSNPEEPGEPEDPEDPAEPETPADPEDPAEPGDPENPGEPEDPQDPVDPGMPEDPESPETPGDPEEPGNPADPEDPSNPENPSDPETPGDPADPEDPAEPELPEDPEDPSDPVDPGEPEDPQDPADPQDPPAEPENPADPEDPTVPEQPGNPENPGEPEDPQNPENPGNPEEPQDPETPGNPADPGDPEDPQDPALPSDLWKSFPDVKAEVEKAGGPEKVWYVADGWLDYVVNAGLMSGYAANAWFGPYDNITRGQVAVILFRAECVKDPSLIARYGSTTDPAAYAAECAFGDMRASDYYTAAVNWAKDAGILTGDSGTNFTTVRPNDPVARQELCLMLARYANGGAAPETQLDPAKAQGILGMEAIAPWARDGVYWAVNNGVIGGVDNHDGTFSMNPAGTTWRSAAAKMFTVVMRDIL